MYMGISEEKGAMKGWTMGPRKSQNIAILTDVRNRNFVLLNIRLQQFMILNINNCSSYIILGKLTTTLKSSIPNKYRFFFIILNFFNLFIY